MITANYFEALTTFRDLLDEDVNDPSYSEYVRGGVNLIADLFPVHEMEVSERMEQVYADLKNIPRFTSIEDVSKYGISYDYLTY